MRIGFDYSHIPLDDPMIMRIKTIVPEEFHRDMWVAGSAATVWGQHGDVDVWVTRITPWSKMTALYSRLAEKSLVDGESTAENYVEQLSILAYSSGGLQILLTEHTIQEVVGNFDIACHAGAVRIVQEGPSPETYQHPFYAPEVKILGWTDPVHTLERVCKFARRYDVWEALKDRKVRELMVKLGGMETLMVPEGL